ncbi:hypothetical protein OZX73_05205 [Bifidobacterium sp. ESL0775]|uniref:FlgK family flagellar hook-associated protein n=1 Tax=Bifidobacterium sp. ESL0775 TaxID=2983230 RepID=UPI0023F8E0F0|nr:hypothetical protein [Bifidobacterium sp. ESL0775]WEV68689.1 hypothetical protein OZX73_05205 [Bifidobacterium sp. ESL0775]
MARQDDSPQKQFDSDDALNRGDDVGNTAATTPQEGSPQAGGQEAPAATPQGVPSADMQQPVVPQFGSLDANGTQQAAQQGMPQGIGQQPDVPQFQSLNNNVAQSGAPQQGQQGSPYPPQGAPQGYPQQRNQPQVGYPQQQGRMPNQGMPSQQVYPNGQYAQPMGNNTPGQPGAPKKPTSKNQKILYIVIAVIAVVVIIALIIVGSMGAKSKNNAEDQKLTGSALYDNANKNTRKLTDAQTAISTDYLNLAQDATKSIPVPEENVKSLKSDVKKLGKANADFAASPAYKSSDKLKKSYDVYAKQSKKYIQYMNSFADSAADFQKANQDCAAKPTVDFEQNNYADVYKPYIQTCQNDLKPLSTSKNAPIKKYADDTNQKMTQIATLTQQIQAMGSETNIFESPSLNDQHDKLTDQLRDLVPDSYSLSFYDAEKTVDIESSLQDLDRVVTDLIKTE